MDQPAPPPKRNLLPNCGCLALFGLIILLLAGLALGPIGPGSGHPGANSMMQASRTIALLMFQYSVDNNGTYPDGKTSTEVFQALLNGKYAADPTVFYIPMPGKTAPVAGEPLKPENVCFDVTAPVDSHAPDGLPLVMSTGYKVNYVPGGMAVPLIKPHPPYFETGPGWFDWLWAPHRSDVKGIAVCYKSNSARFFNGTTVQPDGSIPITGPDFDPGGKTYRQLTPDGLILK